MAKEFKGLHSAPSKLLQGLLCHWHLYPQIFRGFALCCVGVMGLAGG